MLGGMSQSSIKAKEKQLLVVFRQLDLANQKTLQDFADFLVQRLDSLPPKEIMVTQPLGIKRPESESVVKAIKRLTKNYPMVDTSQLLDETSKLMSSHILQGREASEVIDDLEALFMQEFKKSHH